MAGNIWRAFQRNPELGKNLSDFFGALKEQSNREEQYAALQELLFPKGERPVMGNPATIALKGGGTAQLPRIQGGMETYQGPARTISDLSPQESMRLAAILKMAPANAVDLMSRISEAQRPTFQFGAPGAQPGQIDRRTGKWTPTGAQIPREDLTLTIPELAVKAARGDKTAADALQLLSGQKAPAERFLRTEKVSENGVKKSIDLYGYKDQLGQEIITNRKYQDFSPKKGAGGGVAGGAGGLSDVDSRFFLGRIKDLTVSNANLGKEATELMARYKKSPDGETITDLEKVDNKGEPIKIEGENAQTLWNSLEKRLDAIYRQIDQNDQILLHDNQKVGGTWKIPDRGKERGFGLGGLPPPRGTTGLARSGEPLKFGAAKSSAAQEPQSWSVGRVVQEGNSLTEKDPQRALRLYKTAMNMSGWAEFPNGERMNVLQAYDRIKRKLGMPDRSADTDEVQLLTEYLPRKANGKPQGAGKKSLMDIFQ